MTGSVLRRFQTPTALQSSQRRGDTLREDIVVIPLAATTPVPPSDAFVTSWFIDSIASNPDQSITIPTHSGSTYAYTVDWGDGSNDDTIYEGPATHDYPMSSDRNHYIVTIRGFFPRINFSNSDDKDKIRVIRQWGTNVWSSMAGSFAGCTNLTIESDCRATQPVGGYRYEPDVPGRDHV